MNLSSIHPNGTIEWENLQNKSEPIPGLEFGLSPSWETWKTMPFWAYVRYFLVGGISLISGWIEICHQAPTTYIRTIILKHLIRLDHECPFWGISCMSSKLQSTSKSCNAINRWIWEDIMTYSAILDLRARLNPRFFRCPVAIHTSHI